MSEKPMTDPQKRQIEADRVRQWREQRTLADLRQQLVDLQEHIHAIRAELQAEYDRVLKATAQPTRDEAKSA